MTIESDGMTRFVEDAASVAKAADPKPTRPFFWSVRRELWEHRAIWMAPMITAGWLLIMFVLILVVMAKPRSVPALPYEIAPSFMVVVMVVVWAFYCLDTLHGERRDRSILFWKSLPVSDATTVLSKAATALVILPIVTFVITAALQLALWLAHRATGLAVGVPAAPGPFPLLRSCGNVLYGLAAMVLWFAPVCAWCMLVSAWARRAPLVWAMLPLLAPTTVEDALFGTKHLFNRWAAWRTEAFVSPPRMPLLIDPLSSIAPARFLSSPALWIGLAVTALLLFATVRLRRRRSPL